MKLRLTGAVMAVLLSVGGAEGADRSDARASWCARFDTNVHKVVIRNDSPADAKGIACRWTVCREGRPVARGVFSLHVFRVGPLPPHREMTHDVPTIVNDLRAKGGEVSLVVRFVREGEETPFATSQIDFPRLAPPEPLPACDKAPEMVEDGAHYIFKSSGVDYAFSKRTGLPCSIKTGSLSMTEWLKGPATLDGLTCDSVVFSDMTNQLDHIGFNTVSRWRLASQSKQDDAALAYAAHWMVRGDGALVCQSAFVWDGRSLALPRLGCRFDLAPDDFLIEYFGMDANRKDGRLGRYQTSAGTNVRAVSFDAGWDHLSFATGGDPFSFSVTRSTFGIYAASNQLSFVLRPEKSDGAVRLPLAVLPDVQRHAQASRATVLYQTAEDVFPCVVVVDLGKEIKGRGATFVPTDGDRSARGFNLEVSVDGERWMRVLEGELQDRPDAQTRAFNEPVRMRYWRFAATSGYGKRARADVIINE